MSLALLPGAEPGSAVIGETYRNSAPGGSVPYTIKQIKNRRCPKGGEDRITEEENPPFGFRLS